MNVLISFPFNVGIARKVKEQRYDHCSSSYSCRSYILDTARKVKEQRYDHCSSSYSCRSYILDTDV
jgi:hypothetical protein